MRGNLDMNGIAPIWAGQSFDIQQWRPKWHTTVYGDSIGRRPLSPLLLAC